VSGVMPRLEGPNPPGRELSQSNAIQMAIGQGPIAVPPMQVAAAHAALARGGYYLAPLLIRQRAEQQEARDLKLPPRVVHNALAGMYESVHALRGTGRWLQLESGREPIMNLEDLVIRAKTGTAQAPVQFIDANRNGRRDEGEVILRQGDHSWYVCHVQKPGEDRARFVVVVLVEYGGSGGRVSGPVANQVLHALKTEGYL
jgi:penicillin-binding protein 2